METITQALQEDGNHFLQLPSCKQALDGFVSTDISKSQGVCGLPITVGGLKPSHYYELQSS